jgi:hypothetical protein
VVALRGGVEAVDGLAHDVHRGVEPERVVGAAQVVVDRLGDADHGQARGVELARGRERALAAGHDEGVEAEPLDVAFEPLPVLDAAQRVDPRGAEDGASLGEDADDRVGRQGLHVALDEPQPAVADAQDLDTPALGAAHHRADDGVEAGAIAASRQDAHLLRGHGRKV